VTSRIARARQAETAATLLWVLAFAVAIPGILGPDARLVTLSAILASAGFVIDNVAYRGIVGVTPITLFAVGSAVTGVANLIGLLAADGENRILYFIYASPEHIQLAQELALAGAILPVIGFQAVARHGALREVWGVIPRVYGEIAPRLLLRSGVALAAVTLLLRGVNISISLGTLTSLYYLLPSLIAFVLVRSGVARRNQTMVWVGVGIALVEAMHAFAFSYLRSSILTPLFAVLLGALVGTRSVAILRRPVFFPIYAVGAAFVIYFGALGEARQSSGGLERIEVIRGLAEEEGEPTRPRQTLTSRLTTFNQLSRVGDLVETNGFYEGRTLEYLTYAFVPRFLWPEKPSIAKGAWFALEIGQAWVRPDGRISNSVNMTVQGELYLNFGWLGVLLGCLTFGAFLGVLWSCAGFWETDNNTLGAMFGFYLIWIAFAGLGADLQIVVSLIAVYLVFVAGSAVLRSVGATRRVRATPVPLRT
jgi:hypothetical protein